MRQIRIFDTTMRDGEQSPGCSMNPGEKLQVAKQLEKLGVDVIEAGFPISSPEDFQAVQAIAKAVKNSVVCGLARCVEADVRRAYEAVKEAAYPRIQGVIATSDIHLAHKLRMTREEVLEKVREMVTLAASLVEDVEFSAEDASRSDYEYLAQVLSVAAECGAKTLNIPDTVGYCIPSEMEELVRYMRTHVKGAENVVFSVHCHDDLGMGVANTLAAVRAGADQVECTVNGIGERAGNAALEEIVMALRTRRELLGADTRINTKQLYRTSRLISTITGSSVAPNKAVVGANAFAHESGIHQHGVMMERATYEIMNSGDIGIPQNRMVLGKHSGRHAFVDRLTELGYALSDEEVGVAFEAFKKLADQKKSITDRDLEAMVGSQKGSFVPEYTLETFVVNSGSVISATANLKLKNREGEICQRVAYGAGPIDAAFKAIEKATKVKAQLDSYTIQSVTEGEDALGEVVVKLTSGGYHYVGRGLSTDIIEASIKSYLNGINKIIAGLRERQG